MSAVSGRIANFIIGGTEKSATTSVFMYLCDHPQVCGSSRKETNYFSEAAESGVMPDRADYAGYFSRCRASVPVLVEASPCYLADAASVVPGMRSLIPDVKLLFILRDPVDRLYSLYNFHVGKLNIPKTIGFEEYVAMCIAYERDDLSSPRPKVEQWYLKAAMSGRYESHLREYFDAFPGSSIRVTFYEHLQGNESGYMRDLSEFLGIDSEFWRNYEFHRSNVTYTARSELLHKAAVYFDGRTELILRHRPRLKRALVGFYKMINRENEGYDPIPEAARAELVDYYRPHNRALAAMLGRELPAAWNK